MSIENNKENKYAKKSLDHSYYDCEKETDQNLDDLNELDDMCILSDSDCLDLLDDCCENENLDGQLIVDVDELLMLGFFNDFTLIDIGIGDFIREVYFEE